MSGAVKRAPSAAESFVKFAALNAAERQAALHAMECLACERLRICPVGLDLCRNPRQLIGQPKPACPPIEGGAE